MTTGGPGFCPGGPGPDVAIRSRIRTAGPQGVERIDHERKRFEIDLNFLDRFGGGEFVDCGHGENRFALIDRLHGEAAFAPLAGLDHRAIVGKGVGRRGKIVRGENRFDAGHGQRCVRVDALYPRMRHGAEQQFAEQHAFGAKIFGIFRLAGDLRIEIGGLVVLADQLVPGSVLALGSLGVSAAFRYPFSGYPRFDLRIFSAPRIIAVRILS